MTTYRSGAAPESKCGPGGPHPAESGPGVPGGPPAAAPAGLAGGGPAPAMAPPLPAIMLPKGGGAIRGIGEKFAANPVTGTAALAVPLFLSPGRAGFTPALELTYDSGAGNGPFGLGWQLATPHITRKTDRGLPYYRDDEQDEHPDVFILAAEDLVPVRNPDGSLRVVPREQAGVAYRVQHYRPRIEGMFARIERWRDAATGISHWRTISRDNIVSIYGPDPGSRIADPADPRGARIFTWLLAASYDDRGNLITYEYSAENSSGVAVAPYEQNRSASANRYLKRVKYAHSTPYDPAAAFPDDWQLQLVLDYADHAELQVRPEADRPWPARLDPFSSYRAGFEIRTYRLCRRALMFHRFPELGTEPLLVRSTDLSYRESALATFLTAVTQTGYLRNPQDGSYRITDPQTGEAISPRALPPLELRYSEAVLDETVRTVDPASRENLPAGVARLRYQWVDLDGEGLPGVLAEENGAWYYKRNLSNVPPGEGDAPGGNGASAPPARFGPLEQVSTRPSTAVVAEARQQLTDLAGDGSLYLVQYTWPLPGFYKRSTTGDWQPFRPFAAVPNIAWDDPHLRFIDLDGDGHADLLIAGDEIFTWYRALAEAGFAAPRQVRQAADEEQGPRPVFADPRSTIFLADMSGDGLTDLVRIANGEVCYWPNLGYGRFGAKIHMADPPVFDRPDGFDPQRIRLADVDGSGLTDILYLGPEGIRLWANQSGNSWSAPRQLPRFLSDDDLAAVTVIDLLGNGTACLVWSSPLPAYTGSAEPGPLRYIDLMGGQKPHLLVQIRNNLGAETRVRYAASTRYYLQDRAAGTPWITRLPFPVQVVERVESYDFVSQTKHVTRYRYHHGYYDRPEREFRGFGMVEQWDSDTFPRFVGSGLFTQPPVVEGESFHLPPVRSRSWYHTGAYLAQGNVARQYEGEYYRGDARAWQLPDTVLPPGLTADEEREASRALKGRLLRQEIFADDDSPARDHPYRVTEYAYHLVPVQRKGQNRHAVFYAYESENLAYHYERQAADPRIGHTLTLEVDEYGNVWRAASIAYERRPAPPPAAAHPPEQAIPLICYTENVYANRPDEVGWYRVGVPVETRTYEVTGLPRQADRPYTPADLLAAAGAPERPYEDEAPGPGPARRLIEHERTLYYGADLAGPLALNEIGTQALAYESYSRTFTPGLLAAVYGAQIAAPALAALLREEGGYVPGASYQARHLFPATDPPALWWVPSGVLFYAPVPANPPPPPAPLPPDRAFARAHFFLPQGWRDPFGALTRIEYDAHRLLPRRSEDARGNTILATPNYRVLQFRQVTDPNQNLTEAAFDLFGLVAGTAVRGKDGEGDSLAGFRPDLAPATIRDYVERPLAHPHALLQGATTRLVYDIDRYQRTRRVLPDGRETGEPPVVCTLARETHAADLPAGGRPVLQQSFSYSDGFGREALRKVCAAPGKVRTLDAAGHPVEVDADPRWVGTGQTVYDNKGNPVKVYEPFFSTSHRYATEEQIAPVGIAAILRYDLLSRLIRTERPDGNFTRVAFDAWQHTTWDENDTVRESRWFADRRGLPLADPERVAADAAARHAGTPGVAHLDPLGRVFLAVANNGAAGTYTVHSRLDIEGNLRAVTDPLGREAATYRYDLRGRAIYQQSMDAGERWMLRDVGGQPIRQWDSRGHTIRHEYDRLRRPVGRWVRAGAGAERLAERTVYGEDRPAPETHNLRGRVAEQFDGAGRLSNTLFDFKGNLRSSTRELLRNYRDPVDWAQVPAPALDGEAFTTDTQYDALNRPTRITAPDGSSIRPGYNAAGLLERLDVQIRGAADATPFVSNIDYNARGQRILVVYGNGARTRHAYDARTFRLRRTETTRPTGANPLQDLRYTYDPVGNIVQLVDAAQQTIYFDGQVVTASARYVYDAIYRLIGAEGREHIGLGATPHAPVDHDDAPRRNPAHPRNGQALRHYCEAYAYDPAGNITRLAHAAANGGWSRDYTYRPPGHPPGAPPPGNRLLGTSVPDGAQNILQQSYSYDPHGNMTALPHLPALAWDFQDQLQSVSLPGAGTAYYTYDGAGQRVRKVWEKSPGRVEERIYLGGYEIFRRRDGVDGAIRLERQTLHVTDDQRRIALVDTKTIGAGAPPGTLPATLIRYQHGNHLGSAALELDAAANVISYEEYYPYGSTSYQAVRADIEVSPRRYRYTGKERDEETGFYYHGARYYAPWLGRWISCDPAGMRDGPNLYEYVSNSPIGRVDPSGTTGLPAGTITSEGEVRKVDKTGKLQTILKTKEQILPSGYKPPPGTITVEGEVQKVDRSGKLQTIEKTKEYIIPEPSQGKGGQEKPGGEEHDNRVFTGGYGFVGVVADHKAATGEALAIGGYDTKEGPYAGVLTGGGASTETHFGVHSTLHGVEGAGVTSANENLYFFRSEKHEKERIAIFEVETPKIRGVETGIGGFVNKEDPRDVGVFVSGTVGPVTVGGGATFHLNKDFEQEQREVLAKRGISLVRAPEGTPRPPSPYSLRAKGEAWLRFFGINDQWLDRQIRAQNAEFEKSGSGMRLVR